MLQYRLMFVSTSSSKDYKQESFRFSSPFFGSAYPKLPSLPVVAGSVILNNMNYFVPFFFFLFPPPLFPLLQEQIKRVVSRSLLFAVAVTVAGGVSPFPLPFLR